jgi:hypothetical protein
VTSRRVALTHILVAAAAVVVTEWSAVPGVVRGVVGVPFVLLVPGHALLLATGGAALTLPWRMVLVPAVSFAMVMGTALFLDAIGVPVDADGIVLVLFGIVVVLSAVAMIRGEQLTRPLPPLSRETLLWSASMLILGIAFFVAVSRLNHPLPDRDVAGFTELWAVRDGNGVARIGVRSHETVLQTFRLRVEDVGGDSPRDRRITLRPGQQWVQTETRTSQRPQLLRVTLSRAATPNVPYRQVLLRASA